MSLRNISTILVATFLAGVCSLHAQTATFSTPESSVRAMSAQVTSAQSEASAPSASQISSDPLAAEPDPSAVSIDAPGDNAPDVQGLVPIEPSRDPKVTTAEFRSNRVPWQPLPLSDNSPVQ